MRTHPDIGLMITVLVSSILLLNSKMGVLVGWGPGSSCPFLSLSAALHFNLTFLQGTFQSDFFPGTFQFDLFTGHISI